MIRNEFIDEVKITTSPRYKESHLSGDEWRQSVLIKLCWKGNELYSKSFRDMPAAAAWLGWGVVSDEVRFACYDVREKLVDDYCDQPGCSEKYDVKYEIKTLYNEAGDPRHYQPEKKQTQKFCHKHSTRGDCDLQDNDDNYTVVDGSKDPVENKVKKSISSRKVYTMEDLLGDKNG